MFDHPRTVWEQSGWEIDRHSNSPAVNWHHIGGDTLHYPGSGSVPTTAAGVIAWLRNNQRTWVTQRGHSLGYNALVDVAGGVWEVRGLSRYNAANGSTVGNRTRLALVILVAGTASANLAQIAAVRRFAAATEARATATQIVVDGHRDWRATGCPGAGIYTQIRNGIFRPQPEEDDMATKRGARLRINGHQDQLWAETIANPAHLTKADIQGPIMTINLTATQIATLEAQLGFKLTRS